MKKFVLMLTLALILGPLLANSAHADTNTTPTPSQSTPTPAQSVPTQPEIKIGLFYGKNQKRAVTLKGDSPLLLGQPEAPFFFGPQALGFRSDGYALLQGTFPDEAPAVNEVKKLREQLVPAYLQKEETPGGPSFSVWIGPVPTPEEISALSQQFPGLPARGPHKAIVGEALPGYDMAAIQAAELRAKGFSAHPAYDGGWRVAVGSEPDAEKVVELTARITAETGLAATPYTPGGKEIAVVDMTGQVVFFYLGTDPLAVSTQEGKVTVESSPYRGKILLLRDGQLTVINQLPVEQYLYGVVPREIGASWPVEALKAQAVAARTYALANLGRYGSLGFDLTPDTNSQVYGGLASEDPRTNAAVDVTAGVVAVYQGKLISAYFHADSGGYTENSENVWSATVPYIRATPELPGFVTRHEWSVTYTSQEINQKLEAKNLGVGGVLGLRVAGKGPSGRVTVLVASGASGEVSMTKDSIRSVFGLKSTLFDVMGSLLVRLSGAMAKKEYTGGPVYVQTASGPAPVQSFSVLGAGGTIKVYDPANQTFTFKGKGWGHGLGLSQNGARYMAEQGYTFDQILKYYYQGIALEKRY